MDLFAVDFAPLHTRGPKVMPFGDTYGSPLLWSFSNAEGVMKMCSTNGHDLASLAPRGDTNGVTDEWSELSQAQPQVKVGAYQFVLKTVR